MRKGIAWAIVCLLVATGTIASAADISKIKIVEHGVFEARKTQDKEAKDTSIGHINIIDNIKLVKETDTIAAAVGTRFGIRYIVEGGPDGMQVEILVKVLHPRTVNPKNNKGVTLDQWSTYPTIGKITYSGWSFDHSWELAPGKWIIQLWYGDRKLAEQAFTIQAKR
ncbi:MAG TPA: DUF3859 domain-containing protein [Candidatus Brocadiaceae bacterium]|nr:DUF3859 domain-containing protein [Candidatus Brocadiaceae bacterium]